MSTLDSLIGIVGEALGRPLAAGPVTAEEEIERMVSATEEEAERRGAPFRKAQIIETESHLTREQIDMEPGELLVLPRDLFARRTGRLTRPRSVQQNGDSDTFVVAGRSWRVFDLIKYGDEQTLREGVVLQLLDE